MAISGTTVEIEYINVSAGVPIVVGMKAYAASHIVVEYGTSRVVAVLNTHYTLLMDDGSNDYDEFTFTPLAALITAMTALGEGNLVYVRRNTPMTTDMTESDAFVREKLADEITKAAMRDQELSQRVGTLANRDLYVSTEDPDPEDGEPGDFHLKLVS